MKIEQQRGISVTTSVMTFEHGGCTFNLLDTPGHEDFSEDTYRTLTAVDRAVMVIDAAKGIEPQTLKLFEVCRLRDVPIITFINKVDREAQATRSSCWTRSPTSWRSTSARRTGRSAWAGTSAACSTCASGKVVLLTEGDGRVREEFVRPADEQPRDAGAATPSSRSCDEKLELVAGGYPEFDVAVLPRRPPDAGLLRLGAARTSASRELLDGARRLRAAAAPAAVRDARPVEPERGRRSPASSSRSRPTWTRKHRDRVAFVRLCSGRFQRGMKLTRSRHGKQIAVHNPIMFFARERELAEEALAGDIIGIPNHGTLRVGDALTEGEPVRFTGLPNFAPEILRRVRLEDPMQGQAAAGRRSTTWPRRA